MGTAIQQVSAPCVHDNRSCCQDNRSVEDNNFDRPAAIPWHCGIEHIPTLQDAGHLTSEDASEWCPVLIPDADCILLNSTPVKEDTVLPLGEDETLTTSAPDVFLNIYDLNSSVAPLNRVAMDVLQLGAVVHVGVEIFGEEISYGGNGVKLSVPRKNPNYIYRRAVPMGKSEHSQEYVEVLIGKMWEEWKGSDYDILAHNCGTFGDAFCRLLGVGGLPKWVTRLAETADAIRTPIVGAARYVRCDETHSSGDSEVTDLCLSVRSQQVRVPGVPLSRPPVMPTIDLFESAEGTSGADRRPHVEKTKKSCLYSADARWAAGTWGSAKDASVGVPPSLLKPFGDSCSVPSIDDMDALSRECPLKHRLADAQASSEVHLPSPRESLASPVDNPSMSPASRYLGNLSSYASMQEPEMLSDAQGTADECESTILPKKLSFAEALEHMNVNDVCEGSQAMGIRV